MASVIFEEQLELPLGIRSLNDFRQWTLSETFPDSGRIDFVDGNIEVDMSPEEYYSHNAVKVELVRCLASLVKQHDLGELFTDRVRIVSESAGLSAEPDVLFFKHETLDSGRVKFIPKVGKSDLFVEAEGGPDMVAEIVSDGSVRKDTKRLPVAYYDAGVAEYWLIDARKEELVFQIQRRGAKGFEPEDTDSAGFQLSTVFGKRFSLQRSRNARGHWTYELQDKPV